jgi:recombination protein RecT
MTQELTTTDKFKLQIEGPQVQSEFGKFIHSDKMMKRFTAVAIRVVQEKPDLLDADRKSLFIACSRAAQDGLMPDGRESALVVYKTKEMIKGKEVWVPKVQYQPMIQGIRKRLAKAGFHMAAEVYYENDKFLYELGDTPGITHIPFLEGDRGKLKGAYAIATDLNTGEKYREHMNLTQLEQVRAKSKRPNAGAWKDFPDEMHRKSPAKRLLKYIPLVETDIFDMIDRDNEQFDMNKKPEPSSVAQEVQEEIRNAPIQGEVVEPPEERSNVRQARSPEEIQQAVDDDNHVMTGEPPDLGLEPPPIQPLDF